MKVFVKIIPLVTKNSTLKTDKGQPSWLIKVYLHKICSVPLKATLKIYDKNFENVIYKIFFVI